MIENLYNELLKDNSIKKIYDSIEEREIANKEWAFHNYDHVMSVTKLVESILSSLNYDKEFIAKAKIACLFHDVGALNGKENHAYRSFEYAKKYFEEHNISFDGMDDVLEAIRIHSDGFDSNNIIALSLILSDKLDVKKTRIPMEGKQVIGNRQFEHVDDILISINNNCLVVNFITDGNLDIDELNEYYFTKKIFKAVESFSNKMNVEYKILMDNNDWILNIN